MHFIRVMQFHTAFSQVFRQVYALSWCYLWISQTSAVLEEGRYRWFPTSSSFGKMPRQIIQIQLNFHETHLLFWYLGHYLIWHCCSNFWRRAQICKKFAAVERKIVFVIVCNSQNCSKTITKTILRAYLWKSLQIFINPETICQMMA